MKRKKQILESDEEMTLLFIQEKSRDIFKNQKIIISVYVLLNDVDRYWARKIMKKESNYFPPKKRRGFFKVDLLKN